MRATRRLRTPGVRWLGRHAHHGQMLRGLLAARIALSTWRNK